MVNASDPILVEIAENTWRLQGRVGPRNVYQYLIASEDRDELVLIDAGLAETPREVVLPALRHLGLAPSDLRMVVVTHPDVDHQGGLAGLREACENALTACGFADRAMVGDPEKLLADRYGCYVEHALGMGADEIRWVRANYGARVEIDVTFSGGECLRVGDRRLDVHPAPGHSAGHLVLFEAEAGLLFSSDAVHWRACPAADGSPALCPTYEEVDDYLDTISLVEQLSPSEMHSGHWPMRSGQEVMGFLDESRLFVEAVDAVLKARLADPATLADLCQAVQLEVGPWDSEPGMLRFVVSGHMRRLLHLETVELIEAGNRPPRYRLSPGPQSPDPLANVEATSWPT